jgi:hypothetical protein
MFSKEVPSNIGLRFKKLTWEITILLLTPSNFKKQKSILIKEVFLKMRQRSEKPT